MENCRKETGMEFKTKVELEAAAKACADLLLFLQDDLYVMEGYSNMFIKEEKIDGEWLELEEEY